MIRKIISRRRSSSCFRPAGSSALSSPSTTTNLTTSLYHTRFGIFALTWSHTLLGTSVDLHLLPHHTLRRRLTFSPLLFWKKRGSDKLLLPSGPSATLLWDLTHAHFGSGPEPESGFYITIILDSEILLHVGDVNLKSGSGSECPAIRQALMVRREHFHGAKRHITKTTFGGKTRSISIGCDDTDPDPRLVIRFDDKKVLQVKHLRWKFRGGERIDVDGHPILISWDVYNWLFDDCDKAEGFALFTLRFETDAGDEIAGVSDVAGERVLLSEELPAERGWRKKKGLVAKTRSASSSSLSASSASSACGSVLEWESVEETELKGPTGFSLLVYAWKS